MEDFLEMRKNDDAFRVFVRYYLKEAVGKRHYMERLGVNLVSDIATCSDEAFVYLTLENNYDLWTEIAEHRYARWNVTNMHGFQGQTLTVTTLIL
jgi:intergrase/recombinase